MPAAKIQPASNTELPERSFEEIRKEYFALKAHREVLIAEADRIQTALNLAAVPASQLNRAAVAVAEAGDLLLAARRNRNRLIRRHEQIIEDLEDAWPGFSAAKAAYDAAASVETARIAQSLAPRHRAAVQKIADALKALDAAMNEEVAVRDEFASLAPPSILRQSHILPDMSGPFVDACWLEHWDSAGSVWLRSARSLGFTK